MNGTIHSRMSAWCEAHWLNWERLTPGQRQRVEQLAKAPMDHLPDLLSGGLIRWIVSGTAPGHFLAAVLSNDLAAACARADDEVAPHLRAIVRWLYNHAPAICWGSPDRVAAWPLIATRHVEAVESESA